MPKKITKGNITKLWEILGSRAALADRLEVSENTVRRWEKGVSDINLTGYKFEVDRLLYEHGIN
jgi:DNA-binding transcriptional regulator YiaG